MNLRKIGAVLLAAVLMLSLGACQRKGATQAENPPVVITPRPTLTPTPTPEPTPTPNPTPEPTPEPSPTPQEIPVDETAEEATHAGLYRAEDLLMLYQRGQHERIAPASLTKVVTACTALKYCSPDEVFTVGTELDLVQEHSSLCLIRQGHRLTLYQLIMGMFLPSGNDAAYTVAVNVGRRVAEDKGLSDQEAADYFCDLMNDFAREVGATDSHFATPEGWDNEETYSTVYDLALFAAYAMNVEEIREIAATYEKKVFFVSGENITWKNFNSLVNPWSTWYCEQAIGLKTGSTENAGKCLLSVIEGKDGLYIAVVMGCQEDGDRYQATWDLIDLLDI